MNKIRYHFFEEKTEGFSSDNAHHSRLLLLFGKFAGGEKIRFIAGLMLFFMHFCKRYHVLYARILFLVLANAWNDVVLSQYPPQRAVLVGNLVADAPLQPGDRQLLVPSVCCRRCSAANVTVTVLIAQPCCSLRLKAQRGGCGASWF